MNRGVIFKSLREVWVMTLFFGLGLLGVELALAYILPTFHDEMSEKIIGMEFVQKIVQSLIGDEMNLDLSKATLSGVAWVHLVVLILIWAHEITLCTRMPVGEVDRGTIDMLLSMPISRWQLYLSETVVWLVTGLIVIMLGVAGNLLGSSGIPPEDRIAPGLMPIVVVNLFCLYVAVGGLAFCVSALSDRRGRAIGLLFALVLASFFLNFLVPYWKFAKDISFLSVLHYYKPLQILHHQSWPIGDMFLLFSIGAILWLIGGIAFARRNICTT